MTQLPTNFEDFLNKHFQLIESYANDRVHVYSSAEIRVRVVHDRNDRLFMYVSNKENPTRDIEDWIIFSDLRSYMLNNDDYLEYNEFDKVSLFFLENYKDIISLLNTRLDDVKNALSERGMHRANVRFGLIAQNNSSNADKSSEEEQQKKKPWWKL